MGGRDMMACAQTGSGKTAAFLLPVLTGMLRNGVEGGQFSVVQEPQAIIVGPTRELVTQIYNEARKFAHNTMVRPVVVYGGVTTGYQAREVSKGAHLVVGTAGRLLDFIRKGYLSLAKVKYFILDEADRMLDMGFLPNMMALANELGMPAKTERQTLMFSATFPEEVQQLAKELLNDYIFVTVGRVGGANTDIEQHVLQVDQFNKREKLVSILNSQGQQRTLVFVEQKRQADFIASYLSQSEFPTTSIHGDREQREREEALRDFKNGTAPILVATSVAARGLDIPGVNHVINFDMPQSIDEYVHRIGRTGRCGNLGRATSFFNPSSDQPLARPLVKVLVDAQQEIPDWLEALAGESYGTGGFVGGSTQFKDSRGGNFGGSSSNGPSFSSGAAPAPAAGGDEWD
uniref:RNA helicase n=2 Tax=Tubifex tubifex TaxID=6386 RepID=Q1T713_TUBTU|nr:RNA helicase [Tubifex tubifex]